MFANIFYFKTLSGDILCHPDVAQLAMDRTLVLLKFRAKQLEKPAKRTEMESKAGQAKVDRKLRRSMPTSPTLMM